MRTGFRPCCSSLGPSLVLCIWLCLFFGGLQTAAEASVSCPQRLQISGKVLDPHLRPIKGAKVRVLIEEEPQSLLMSGRRVPEIFTDSQGFFFAEILPPRAFEASSKLTLELSKRGFLTVTIPIEVKDFFEKGGILFLNKEVSLPRKVGPSLFLSVGIFLVVYFLMACELIHRTVVTMAGSAVILLVSSFPGTFFEPYRMMTFSSAVDYIDLNAVFLLFGSMILAGVFRRTGVFDFIVGKCFTSGARSLLGLSLLLATVTAFISTVADNVATMVLVAPVTIELAKSLRIDPFRLLVVQVLAANVGGSASLLGDVTNVLIGSRAGLSFVDFLENLGPISGLCLVLLFLVTFLFYSKRRGQELQGTKDGIHKDYRIVDKGFVLVSVLAGLCVLILLFFHGQWGMEPSVPVLVGASALLTWGIATKRIPLMEFMEREIEWPLLTFLMFLFILVGALDDTGALFIVCEALRSVCAWNPAVGISIVLWGSALISAFVDNLPLTLAMLPVVSYLSQTIPDVEGQAFVWALALGASLGANGTIIGGSANMVAMGIANSAGYPISFSRFMKIGFPFTLLSVGLCNVWLVIFYLG